MGNRPITLDGNEAASRIAHLVNEVIAIYPITPVSPMGEHADEWSAQGKTNLWGAVPSIIEMQSEAGAAGTMHGALQTGALTTTFTASQGLLLMLPNMYKIAGELTPMVLHVAARSLAAQALSIFCDHSDVMAARGTGFSMLAANSVQEVMDMALIAQAASLESRVPILHFFDGFRTSHEVAKIVEVDGDICRQMIDDEWVHAHRSRALNPEKPVIRGTSQNPDVYFQARESVNPFYQAMPAIVQSAMNRFAELTGRQYKLYEYVGAEDAEQILILMGSGCETVEETIADLNQQGERLGLIKVRLYRPFDAGSLCESIPETVKRIAVLDRCKEPGANGEPLYKDVITALAQQRGHNMPAIIGGRYGLSSKEFTPGMVKAIVDELKGPEPKNPFTIGIDDDLCHTSLAWDSHYKTRVHHLRMAAVFYGLGSDGTVSANKNSIRIIGDNTELHAQGYFVYDSKKSGAVTVSHLRFGADPIHSSYLIGPEEAGFVACHQAVFVERYPLLEKAAHGAVFLLNTPVASDAVWDSLPAGLQQEAIDKNIRFYAIDAAGVARDAGLGNRINTIMQVCFFALSEVLPIEQAIEAIKAAVKSSYGKRGQRLVDINYKAIDATLEQLKSIPVPDTVTAKAEEAPDHNDMPSFVQEVTARLIAGQGDQLPVSQLPCDGTYPTGTAAWEKRNLAAEIPVWDEELCIHCGKCPFVCPHGSIRSKVFDPKLTAQAPPGFKHAAVKGKDFDEGLHISYQVAPEDCTGCGLCVDICPVRDKKVAGRKALNMEPQAPLREQEHDNWQFFVELPDYDRRRLRPNVMKSAMVLETLFEFSGACSGCGETPYVKLASQLFGDRMIVANATGCSSIYGGNLPTTPWTKNQQGHGPAWNNSLFEDNAEFGLGFRISIDQQAKLARALLTRQADTIGRELVKAILSTDQSDESGLYEQRQLVKDLREKLSTIDSPEARQLLAVSDQLIRKSVWIMGGDGWAYDIGFGGLDHVLASGRDVNILVLDTEVYSNTGGQTSKATPRGAVAKFSAGGKPAAKKDLAMIAMAYENVYVAQVAYAGKDIQTLKAFLEAESYPGTSLIIAYSPCIAWGNDMANNHQMQDRAIRSGHWPLFRYDPRRIDAGLNPLQLDSKPPSIPYRDFVSSETRFKMLWQSDEEQAEEYLKASQAESHHHYQYLKELAELPVEDTDKEPPGKED